MQYLKIKYIYNPTKLLKKQLKENQNILTILRPPSLGELTHFGNKYYVKNKDIKGVDYSSQGFTKEKRIFQNGV